MMVLRVFGLSAFRVEKRSLSMYRKLLPCLLFAFIAGSAAVLSAGANEPVAGGDDPFAENTSLVSVTAKEAVAVRSKLDIKEDIKEEIKRTLDEPTQMEFTDTSLSDVIAYLVAFHKAKHPRFEIQLDTRALNDLGVTADTTVTKNLKGISLRSALRLMLRDLGLTYVIRDEVLLITTPEEAELVVYRKVYDVSDLISPADREKGTAFESLVDMIAKTAKVNDPQSRGPGCWISSIKSSEMAVIAICQTEEIQEDVAQLLKELRHASHPEQ
jgi:hypothetical protein